MRIIPAIDIINGQCVRLSQGDYTKRTVYHNDPVEVARAFEDAGITYLHVVDLDGAKSGHIVNQKILEAICSKTTLKVDFGGGIKSDEDIQAAIDCGASQVTCGSLAVKDPEKVREWGNRYGHDKIILGADVKDNKVAIQGWTHATDYSVQALLDQFMDNGFSYAICTDISTDGTLSGPNITLYQTLIHDFPTLNLIASGGVGNMDDLIQLESLGVEGAIIGKAIYEGKITLNALEHYHA